MMNGLRYFLATVAFMALASSFVSAYDPSPLQAFCVALDGSKNDVFVNGKFCKNPKLVNADDFFFTGLNIPRNTSNAVGSNVTLINVDMIPGLNTLGISFARIDYAPNGLNPPHTHPRASEILMCAEGTLMVGSVTSNPNNQLFTKILHLGDLFVFPIGLIHFQFNMGETHAVAFSGLGSHNPSLIVMASALFGSDPPISIEVLEKAFQVDKNVIKELLMAQFMGK
ncbi:hypothetical protein L1049_020126 [Liquidambar formosana]|uniref:Germin-like protein n=1 Tax=Liquidambar formosana TaxID=63359 RepID=A0AAP0S7Y0_LIQFO